MATNDKINLDTWRYLAGGLAVAVVAGGASYVVYLLGTVFSADPLQVPANQGSARLVELSGSDAFRASFVAGLVATAVLWLLILVVPAPTKFFGWIGGLFAAAVTVLPFSFPDTLSFQDKAWIAAINLVGAVLIVVLLLSVLPRVVEPPAEEPPRTTP
jgi:hypothetical protein